MEEIAQKDAQSADPTTNINIVAGEVKTALDELIVECRALRTKPNPSHNQEKGSTMTYEHPLKRPALETVCETVAPHKKAFATYLRTGCDDELRGLNFEEKALSTSISADGGYLVDPQIAETIENVLDARASIRSIANVVNVEASTFDILIDRGGIGAGWNSETGNVVETSTSKFERVSISLHELSAMPKASQRLLDDSAFDVEEWLSARIADKFTIAEGAAFVSGNGSNKPTGFLHYPKVSVGQEAWGKLGFVKTGKLGDFNTTKPADAIVDLVYALGALYRANAHFVMNSKTAGAVRKMKDADGRFLWSDGLAAKEPARLMGYPVLVSEDMPDIAANSFSIAFGDFAKGYTIAERPDLRVLRDPFSAKPHVLFYATKRVGGAVTDSNGIKLLKFAA